MNLIKVNAAVAYLKKQGKLQHAAAVSGTVDSLVAVDAHNAIVYENLLTASRNFFAWYNKHYPDNPSAHPDHPWCILGKVLGDSE